MAGNKGSTDLARDVRGFATKFYTREGNWDLVGNNIPVFFIQDAIKFPDVIHAAKQEPDRGFPQAQTAHDNFWDFVSLLPESAHMLMWIIRTGPSRARSGSWRASACTHAVADALLGAAGLGDLGEHFPDTDPRWQGADSIDLLREVVVRLRTGAGSRRMSTAASCANGRNWRPSAWAMQARLSDAAGAPVTVKGRRAESLGALGRGEGIACWASALVVRR